jgi:hypothetical protein
MKIWKKGDATCIVALHQDVGSGMATEIGITFTMKFERSKSMTVIYQREAIFI